MMTSYRQFRSALSHRGWWRCTSWTSSAPLGQSQFERSAERAELLRDRVVGHALDVAELHRKEQRGAP